MRLADGLNSPIAVAAVLAFAASACGEEYYSPWLGNTLDATATFPWAQPVIADAVISEESGAEWTTAADDDASLGLPNGCGGIGDIGSPCCWSPLWTVRAGVIILRRDSQDNLVLTNGATPITVGGLASNDYQTGPLITAIRHGVLDTPYDFEVTYFGIPRFSNTATTAGATAFFTNPTINFGALPVTATYSSNFHSTELNLRRRWNDWFTVLSGFRWIEMRDNLATNIGGLATDTINVNNHLYGYQIGADIVLWRRGAFTIDGFGKAGIYGNSADQTTTIAGVGGAIPALGASGARTAFVGELALNGMYAINDRWSIRSGYQALWLDGVALAPDQIAPSNIVTGASTLDRHGHPIFHGLTITAQMVW